MDIGLLECVVKTKMNELETQPATFTGDVQAHRSTVKVIEDHARDYFSVFLQPDGFGVLWRPRPLGSLAHPFTNAIILTHDDIFQRMPPRSMTRSVDTQ